MMGDILFLAHRVPYPPDRGDKIRAYHILKHLAARANVHVVAFADDPTDLDRESGIDLGETHIVWRGKSQAVAGVQALLSGKPVSLTAFHDARVRRAVADVMARHFIDTVYVYSGQMAQYLPTVPGPRIIMDFVDMDSAKFETYGATTSGFAGWMMRREADQLRQFETQIAARVDASLFVSEAEAALFRDRTGAQRVRAIVNGIDTATFAPDAAFEPLGEQGPLVVFTGQMDYRPNIEGVQWFAEAMLPVIRSAHPLARFAIVGRNPDAAVRSLATRPGVIVTGEVADVRPWLAAADVVVAPLKLARGVQNKVLEAMAMARPVIATKAAATGIDHGHTLTVADTPQEFVDAVIADLVDPSRAARRGDLARQRVIARHGWAAQLAPLDDLLGWPGARDAVRAVA